MFFLGNLVKYGKVSLQNPHIGVFFGKNLEYGDVGWFKQFARTSVDHPRLGDACHFIGNMEILVGGFNPSEK